MRTEAEERAAVIAEARSWLHTPWRHRCAIKGEAVDCAMFLAAVFTRAGVVPDFCPLPYARLHMMHQDEERFLGMVDLFGAVEVPVSQAQPGDVFLYKLGKVYSHGAILVEPQLVIHSFHKNRKVIYTETFDAYLLAHQPRSFDMWAGRRTA